MEFFSLFHCLSGHLSVLDIFPLIVQMSISFLSLSHSYFSFFSKYQAEIGYIKSDPQFIVPWKVYKLGISGKIIYSFGEYIILTSWAVSIHDIKRVNLGDQCIVVTQPRRTWYICVCVYVCVCACTLVPWNAEQVLKQRHLDSYAKWLIYTCQN